MRSYRLRRYIAVLIVLVTIVFPVAVSQVYPSEFLPETATTGEPAELVDVATKGRAPKTGYERNQFGNGWDTSSGCDTRNRILQRDLRDVVTDESCKVQSGTLNDPYTGRLIKFIRGETTSDDVQIDHVVALSNAWQTGAQQLTYEQRVAFANDPLNLLAVDGPTNEKKSDGDAATWLPPNKSFRCQYVGRQLSVKHKYMLWVTPAERDAMKRVLSAC